jgi:hypothetical protein
LNKVFLLTKMLIVEAIWIFGLPNLSVHTLVSFYLCLPSFYTSVHVQTVQTSMVIQ